MGFLGNLLGKKKELLWIYKTDGKVFGVRFSPDNSLIAAGSGLGSLYILDRSGNCLWSYKTGDEIRNAISYSADSSIIAVGSFDKKVYLFNRLGELQWNYKTGDRVSSVIISADGSIIAVGSEDGKLYLLDRSGELLWCKKLGDSVGGVSLSADGSIIAARTTTYMHEHLSKIYLFSRLGKLLWSHDIKYGFSNTSMSTDGAFVATNADGEIYLFNRSGELLWSKEIGIGSSDVSLSSDGSLIAAGIGIGVESWALCLLDRSGKLLWSYKTVGVVRQMSCNNSLIAVASHNDYGEAYLFNCSGKLWSYKTKIGEYLVSVSISPDGSSLSIGSTDNKIYLFDIKKVQVAFLLRKKELSLQSTI
jgi:outer membrane protein assembly factor BamB